jgi:hypothetical protein
MLPAMSTRAKQPVDIVAQGARGAAEALVGHEQRARCIVAEPDREEVARGLGLQGCGGDDFGDLARERERGNLIGQLEAAGFVGLRGIELKRAGPGIEAAQGTAAFP